MITKVQVQEIFAAYLKTFPEEEHNMLRSFINDYDGQQLFDRKNFAGHITASALILDKTRTQVYLLRHKFLKIDLPPGGHVDISDESIIDAAYRETAEEADIKREELQMLRPKHNIMIPVEINSHSIPANHQKNEPPHVHHDFRYLFIFYPDREIIPDPEESSGGKWWNLEALAENKIYRDILMKIRTII
jgi:8-oxo-dGTP pyrophosphatase MutT (NUDIX family)